MAKLRIKVDYESTLQWMFCDLNDIKTILHLSSKIKQKYGLKADICLSLDDAILPKDEPIEILNNGDLIKVDILKETIKKSDKKQSDNIISSASSSLSSTSTSSSSSSSEDEGQSFEQPFKKGTSYLNKENTTSMKRKIEEVSSKESTDKASNELLNKAKVQDNDMEKKKRKRRRKNKNKNKLPEETAVKVISNPRPNPYAQVNVPSQAKITKFNDTDEESSVNTAEKVDQSLDQNIEVDESSEKQDDFHNTNVTRKNNKKKKNKNKLSGDKALEKESTMDISTDMAKNFEVSSSAVSCEEMLLESFKETTTKKKVVVNNDAPQVKASCVVTNYATEKKLFKPNGGSNGLENLLKLAEKPIKVKKAPQKTIADLDVCTNKSVILTNKSVNFEPDKINEYPIFENEIGPQIGQIFAFMCLQIGPDYTPQMTRYVGELKQIENGQALFLILYDENEGKNRSEKFEIDCLVEGLLLKNREVHFEWSQLNDIRIIK